MAINVMTGLTLPVGTFTGTTFNMGGFANVSEIASSALVASAANLGSALSKEFLNDQAKQAAASQAAGESSFVQADSVPFGGESREAAVQLAGSGFSSRTFIKPDIAALISGRGSGSLVENPLEKLAEEVFHAPERFTEENVQAMKTQAETGDVKFIHLLLQLGRSENAFAMDAVKTLDLANFRLQFNYTQGLALADLHAAGNANALTAFIREIKGDSADLRTIGERVWFFLLVVQGSDKDKDSYVKLFADAVRADKEIAFSALKNFYNEDVMGVVAEVLSVISANEASVEDHLFRPMILLGNDKVRLRVASEIANGNEMATWHARVLRLLSYPGKTI